MEQVFKRITDKVENDNNERISVLVMKNFKVWRPWKKVATLQC